VINDVICLVARTGRGQYRIDGFHFDSEHRFILELIGSYVVYILKLLIK